MKSVVNFADSKIKKALEELKISTSEDKQLYNFICRAISEIGENSFVGINIPKRLIPREYIKKYDIDNLWKYDLPNGWRLVYTVKRNSVMIITVILEWFCHKDYERKFNY